MIFEVAHWMGLVPLVWLVGLHLRGRSRDVGYWWLGVVFAVSFLADSAAHVMDPALVGNLYPISQAGILGAVFLTRAEAVKFVTALLVVASIGVLWSGMIGVDVLLRTVAWGGAVGIVWDRKALAAIRTMVLVTFGLGLVAWWGYAIWPGWPTWIVYQSTRAIGIALFCWAVLDPRPVFKLERTLP